jgi:hypothetical protein
VNVSKAHHCRGKPCCSTFAAMRKQGIAFKPKVLIQVRPSHMKCKGDTMMLTYRRGMPSSHGNLSMPRLALGKPHSPGGSIM